MGDIGGGGGGGGGGGCDADDAAVRVFLRFSPLIGGPSFLPLHVEVIFALLLEKEKGVHDADADAEGETEDEEEEEEEEEEPDAMMMDAIHVAWDDVGFPSSSSSYDGAPAPPHSERGISALHRFDFLPSGDPADPATLRRLLTLGGVPGRVRHRIHHRGRRGGRGGAAMRVPEDDHHPHDDDDDGGSAERRRRRGSHGEEGREKREERGGGGGLSILVPVGSVVSPRRRSSDGSNGGGGDDDDDDGRGGRTTSTNKDANANANEVVDAAAKFNDERGGGSSSFDELRVFGGKNCLSFALDLLSHVDSEFGIRSCGTATTFPPRIRWTRGAVYGGGGDAFARRSGRIIARADSGVGNNSAKYSEMRE